MNFDLEVTDDVIGQDKVGMFDFSGLVTSTRSFVPSAPLIPLVSSIDTCLLIDVRQVSFVLKLIMPCKRLKNAEETIGTKARHPVSGRYFSSDLTRSRNFHLLT